jgi:predicted extracellular nuclease
MSKIMRRWALRGLLSCCAAFGLTGMAQAQQVVISQVYGGGGNSGATLKSDFIELHNNGTSAVDLAGWSVQYASATGTSWQVTTLSGSIAPGGYYLVKEADGSGGTTTLPTPDATGTIPMSGTAGKVALVNSTTALSGACPAGNIDFVGFGSTANCSEGSTPTPAPSNTLAVLRAVGGCTDSNNNGADFATGTPTPRNSASTVNVCGGGGQPVLNIADVVQAEGNSGSSTFTFIVSLSEPAGAGGVSFDIATANGTASAGSDYTSQSLTAQTIPSGSSTYSFSVSVQGDTDNEADETFFVNIGNVTGALAGDVQAIGTIVNDDIVLLPIHDIQGNGDSSPLAGQVVTTGGIVTARRNNGFFIQMPDAEADADPLTSEGVFVFTNATPPAAATVGNRVQVRGTVVEYVPSADPTQPPLTEIGSSPVVTQLSSGNALPTPVALTATFPDADGAYNQLERLEGMRITAASLTVNTPTLGNVSEPNATGSSNGVFHAVVTGQPRAYRKPGVQQPDPLPAGSGANVPRWNTSPQVIAVSSNALGGGLVNAASGCLVSNATGPLDYSFRRYTLYPEQALQVQCNGADQPKAALLPTADDVTVASFNMQRFFDTVNDPAIGEPVLTPTAYENRLNKASLAIRNYLNTPDIVGVQEVENLTVLQTVATRINNDAVAAGQPNPEYVAYLVEGNDVGGIDVGFLVKSASVGTVSRIEVVGVTQEGKSTTWTAPDGSTSLLNDRPPLVLEAQAHFTDGRSLPLTVIAVHQRSLNGMETDDAEGLRIRAKRQKQAEFLANLLQTRQTAKPSEHVLVLGDFNAFEFNDGYVDPMGIVTGHPSPDDETVIAGDGADLVNPDYDDLTFLHTPDQSYSYAYDGNVQSLDHVIANTALMNSDQLETVEIDHARINADFPETARNDANTPTRLSDHDPAVVLLRLKAQQFADLGVAANVTPSSVQPGQTATFNVDASNAGPNAAAFAGIAFAFDHGVSPVVAAPAGWVCGAPETSPTGTVVSCSKDSFAAGDTQTFTLQVLADTALAGGTLTLATSITSQTPDTNAANDNASTVLTIELPPTADLALSIGGPATLPSSTFSAQYTLTLSNGGQLAAAQPTLTISGNTLVTTSTLVAPAGWTCTKIKNGARAVSFSCSSANALAPAASVGFTLKTNVKPTPAGGVVTVQGTAATTTTDSDASNNSATFSSTVN